MHTDSGQWFPPGKDCGLCGCSTCSDFLEGILAGKRRREECPFFSGRPANQQHNVTEAVFPQEDILGKPFDFVLCPLPGEASARKIVLPFRGDIVEKNGIKPGDLILGRPMGAGCPIPHVLKVIKAESITGLLYTWVVGPKYAREGRVLDISAYHMVGFEGIASHIKKEPMFGHRQRFLPGFCMMSLGHTGVVNMVLSKSHGLHIRIEDVRIL